MLLALALICDMKTYKVKNIIVFPFMIAGLLTNTFLDGLKGIAVSLWGIFVPIALLITLYGLRMLGAGDIKLFSAVGAVMGTAFTLHAIAYSFLAGGIMALIIIIARKNGLERLKHLLLYMKSCFLTLSFQPYTDFSDKSDGSKFHFSYAIGCGVVIGLTFC